MDTVQQIAWIVLIFSIILIVAAIWMISVSPVSGIPAAKGVEYKVGPVRHKLPYFVYKGSHPYLLNEDILATMLNMYKDVTTLLDKHDIEWWGVCGTFLGAVRHHGLIPWDDDIDLAVWHDDLEKIRKAVPDIHEMGYLWEESTMRITANNRLKYPFVDIVLMGDVNGKCALCVPLDKNGQCTFKSSKKWAHEIYEIDRIFPLREVPFEDTTIRIPHDISLLNDTYPGWRIEARHGANIPSIMNHFGAQIWGYLIGN